MRPFRTVRDNADRLAFLILALVLAALLPAPVKAECQNLWRLNTSTLCLTVDGASRVFRYEQPREGMRDEGVVSGTLLFSGTVSGTQISGISHVFSRRCGGAVPYTVAGGVSVDGRRIVMHGQAPSGFNKRCEPNAFRNAVLELTRIDPAPPASVIVAEAVLPQLREQQRREAEAAAAQQRARAEALQREVAQLRRAAEASATQPARHDVEWRSSPPVTTALTETGSGFIPDHKQVLALVAGALAALVIVGFLNFRAAHAPNAAEPQQPAAPPASPQSAPSLIAALSTAIAPAVSRAPSLPPQPIRDTATAVAAMELAHAYMREIDDDVFDAVADPAKAHALLTTNALASKQLAIAEQNDPDASVSIELKDGSSLTFSLRELKAQALYYEGICRIGDNPKRAVRILEQACALAPESGTFHFWAGFVHDRLFNKRQAIAAFEKALAINPTNLEYRKALDRARNMSGARVLFDRAVTAFYTTISIGRWTAIAIGSIIAIGLVSAIAKGDSNTIVFFIGVVFAVGLVIKMAETIRDSFRG